MTKTKKILLSALMLTSCIVLSRFLAIRTPIISIGFSFVPLILTAIILGPKYSSIIGLLSDLIGALLFPSGAYFVGFTISGFLTGLVYGLLLYNKNEFKVDKKFIIHLIIAILIVCGLINGVLNTIWIFIITNQATKIIVPVRIIKQLLMLPIEFFTIFTLGKLFANNINEMRCDND